MDNKKFTVIIEKDEDDFFVASVPSLPGCHTQARKMEELYPRIREAIELCLDEEQVPIQLDFVGVQELEITHV